jgi:hypothetical protein
LTVGLVGRANIATNAYATLTAWAPAPPGPYGFPLRVARALETAVADTEVHAGVVDSLTPPAYVLEWADPWSTPATPCIESVTLEIVCIAGRVEPDPGIDARDDGRRRARRVTAPGSRTV